ncbi:MAG: cytochrome c oxidase subunit II [Chitinophagales bacterium]|nr:cytochrome c oxidase subunit II [Chitinophagaceae bacterium]MCB9065298.1 cytochrome c oxidase subunit II [Chitinophagales bacterium]
MSGFTSIVLTCLVFFIIYQIAKASELAAILRGEEKSKAQVNRLMAWLLVAFFVLGLYGLYECHVYLTAPKFMLPVSASQHGVQYDSMFTITLIVTGIVFFLTQALLFWFAFKYQSTEKRTSFFYPHNNKLELLWTTIPAIAMFVLVVIGLKNWNTMTDEAPKDAMVVEVVGKQFNWIVRYPGADGELGKRDFRIINDVNNVLGQDWNDKSNLDDIVLQNGELHIVKDKPVKLIIGSRDVIHDVGLPHFRMKMDAVPGIITTMWFTPLYTTAEMKEITGNPDFVYEISCDQMCGKGHYSMRGTVIVHTQEEYDAWIKEQQSYYAMNNADAAAPAENNAEHAVDSVNVVTMK